ncbi:hypothetical protein DPMN_006943 [Dreissena polymorpha]|uniref:HAT C-terminal dimerisation domain-containing protein n=1 Tax=Dreissena polymorpha TaxID=45954 RepID=A0A9D4MTD1_DREPO|nr:hypothetical protein DPMN_006943 [Dreissena polymorpha]
MSLADLYTEEFDNLYSLLDLLLSLPPTSVPCESTFSHLKLLKTHRRLRLRQDTLNSLMMIKLSTPDVTDYDPSAAVDKWLVRFDGFM